jgi:acetolactate synthase I/II/III large subunit
VEETITHRLSIHRYLDMLKPGSFFAGCIGGLGTGTGTALGVKAAFPKRPVLCLIGDGAFNYDPGLAALGVCQEHQLPIMIVLYNNYGYHSQKSGVPRFFPDGFAVKNQDFIGISINPSPDYATVARAFDGYGEKVEEPGEVRRAPARAQSHCRRPVRPYRHSFGQGGGNQRTPGQSKLALEPDGWLKTESEKIKSRHHYRSIAPLFERS